MNLVAIVGRPNVGKSTLFNRLVGRREAIVESEPGITRDRIYGMSEWNGKQFQIIDTGGFIPGDNREIESAIREQAHIAIEESNAILFVVDAIDGVTAYDIDIARILRTSKKPVVLVVNKCDNTKQENFAYEFYNLGLGEPYPISAMNGHNTGDFLDELVNNLPDEDENEGDDQRLKIAVVGRPNAGKSSLTNALLGKNRSIVTEIPGTTRDSIDSILKYYNEEIILIDTAGLRKKSNITENVEFYSILRTARAIERSDVAIVLLDATHGLEDQDKKIINQVDEARKGIIVAVNKWDLVEKNNKSTSDFEKEFYYQLPRYNYLPLVFISALTKQRITKVVELAKTIQERRMTHIKTSDLNSTLLPILDKTPTPSIQGKDLRINFITQVKVGPPVFAFFCNYPLLIPDNYKRFLENILRQNFPLEGVPISLIYKSKH
ncbi:MAG: ribosome biogenesis GTPase Der [Chloroherpetonaceae bacterium]